MGTDAEEFTFDDWLNRNYLPSVSERFDSTVESLATGTDEIRPRLFIALFAIWLYHDSEDELPIGLRDAYQQVKQDIRHRTRGSEEFGAVRAAVRKMGKKAAAKLAKLILQMQRELSTSNRK